MLPSSIQVTESISGSVVPLAMFSICILVPVAMFLQCSPVDQLVLIRESGKSSSNTFLSPDAQRYNSIFWIFTPIFLHFLRLSLSNHHHTCQGMGSPADGERWGQNFWGWRGLQGKGRVQAPCAGSSRGRTSGLRASGRASLRCAEVPRGRARRWEGGFCKEQS